MPVINTDWKFRHPATRAVDFSTSNIGGAKTTTDVNQVLTGSVFFDMPSAAPSGGTKTQYAKVFIVNTNGTSSATNCKMFLENALDDVSGNQIVKLVSSSASDNSTYSVKIIGKSDAGAPLTHTIALNGTTEVQTTGILWSAVYRGVYVDSATGAVISNAVGDISITHGTTPIGKIPAGRSSATSEVAIGIETGLDGSQTTTTASAAPTSVTFFKPKTEAAALSFQGGGTLAAGVGQGIWLRLTVAEATDPSSDITFIPKLVYESV